MAPEQEEQPRFNSDQDQLLSLRPETDGAVSESVFTLWMSHHSKSYPTSEEFKFRFDIFRKNALKIRQFKDESIELGLNKFADWTDDEYKQLLGFKPDTSKAQNATKTETLDFGALPESIDWVKENKVTPIKDQGSCGSCWSFSTTGSVESAYMIKNNKEVLLSEQQLVDCTVSFGNNGCGGGLVEYAYHYMEKIALDTEAEYPYKASNNKCSAVEGEVKLTNFKEVQRYSPTQLAQAMTLGPVSVGVCASGMAFKFYKKGIIKKFCCPDIDHAVLAVGYGTEKGEDYWVVKNSWGADWGEKGYFRLYRDMNASDPGTCGIYQTPTYPIL